LGEGSLVQATKIAKEYPYTDHFLCVWQLWTAKGWGFGGSLPGCDADTMSFKVGKIQMVFGMLGLITLVCVSVFQKKIVKKKMPLFFIALISLGAFFLTTYFSRIIWDLFSPIMAIFQFPWRLIAFGMVGTAVMAGYFFVKIPAVLQKFMLIILLFILFIPGRKYFIKPLTSFDQYNQEFNSPEYFSKHLAYKLPEYLVTQADLAYWRSLEETDQKVPDLGFDFSQPLDFSGNITVIKNDQFEKIVQVKQSGDTTLNIHYFPFWKLFVNDIPIIPKNFDRLGRPMLSVATNDIVRISYHQSQVEQTGNIFSLLGIILLLLSLLFYDQSFQKKKRS
jgi:hypothetical protein